MCQTYDVCFICNLGNKNLGIYHRFNLILCYFWRQNCLKTWILAFWTTLVNSCWPHVCDMTKDILGACKYISQVPSPKYHVQKCKSHHVGWKKHFFVPTGSWWYNHLQISIFIYPSSCMIVTDDFWLVLGSFTIVFTGTISAWNFFLAAAARACDMTARVSWSCRETPNFFATFSDVIPMGKSASRHNAST